MSLWAPCVFLCLSFCLCLSLCPLSLSPCLSVWATQWIWGDISIVNIQFLCVQILYIFLHVYWLLAYLLRDLLVYKIKNFNSTTTTNSTSWFKIDKLLEVTKSCLGSFEHCFSEKYILVLGVIKRMLTWSWVSGNTKAFPIKLPWLRFFILLFEP